MGWETRYRQGSLPPKSGHGAVPVRLPFSSSFLPFRFSFPARCSACPVPSIAFTEGSGALGGVPALGPSGGSRLCPQAEGAALHLPWSPPPPSPRRTGGPPAPPALPHSRACGPGPRESGPGSEALLPPLGRLPRRERPLSLFRAPAAAVVECCVGGRGEGWGRDHNAFFLGGRRHLSHVRINKRLFSLKKTTPSLPFSVCLPTSVFFFLWDLTDSQISVVKAQYRPG